MLLGLGERAWLKATQQIVVSMMLWGREVVRRKLNYGVRYHWKDLASV
jgi:hypothetical protein